MTSENAILEEVMDAIQRAYKSWESPDFDFVQQALDAGKWDKTIALLRGVVRLEEITDPNVDVSRVLVAHIDERPSATLQLSFLGSYGVLFRHAKTSGEIFIAGEADVQNDMEASLVSVCSSSGVRLLPRAILSFPVRLVLFDAQPERVRVYQALFSDVEFMPGEYESL